MYVELGFKGMKTKIGGLPIAETFAASLAFAALSATIYDSWWTPTRHTRQPQPSESATS